MNDPLVKLQRWEAKQRVTCWAVWFYCVVAALSSFAAAPAGYYLVWSDDFDGTTVDTNKWKNWALGGRRDATNSAAALSIGGGNFTITTFTSNNVHYTGGICSDSKFLPRYGYLEANINYDDSPGQWSAFWVQSPTMGKYIGDYATSGTEIDICEHRKVDSGNNNIEGSVVVNIHWDGYGTYHKSVGSGSVGTALGTGFHVYGLEWSDAFYRVLIDGSQKWSNRTAVSAHTGYIILSSEVESNSWAGNVPAGGYGDSLSSTTKMVVDYVRYYAPTTTVFWSGAASGYWTNAANWVANRSPATNNDVVLSYLGTTNFTTALGQNYTLLSLSLLDAAAAMTINSNKLTLNGGGIDLVSARTDLTIGSLVGLGAAQTWKVATNRTLSVNGEVSGTGNLMVDGYGTVRLGGSNSFTGTVTVDGGFLTVAHSDALGATGAVTTVNSNGQLIVNGSSSSLASPVDEPLRIYGNTNGVYAAPLRVSGASTPAIVWNGPLTLLSDAAIQVDGSRSLTFSNALAIADSNMDLTLAADGGGVGAVAGSINLSNGAVYKQGSGTWRFYADNDYSGETRIMAGSLVIYHTNALKNTTVNLDTNDTGTLSLNNLNAVLGGLKGARNFALGSGSVSVGNNNQSNTYGGILSGSGKLIKVGSSSQTLTGACAYAGGTVITQGTLQLGENTASGSVPGTITNNSRLAIYRSDAVTLTNPVYGSGSMDVKTSNGLTINASAPVIVSGGVNIGQNAYGKLVLLSGAQVVAGSLAVGNTSGTAGDVWHWNGDMNISGLFRIGHWPGETSSYTFGGGTLTLTGKPTNTVNSSAVLDQAGILYVGIDGTGAFTQTGGVVQAEGIVLDGRGETAGTDSFTLQGGTFVMGSSGIKSGNFDSNSSYLVNLGGGTLEATADWSSTRALTFTGTNGSTTLNTRTNRVVWSGPITGVGGLVKTGSGMLTLSNSHSYAGATVVSNGTLYLAGTLSGGGMLAILSGARLQGEGTNVGPVTVAGTLAPGSSVGVFATGSQTWNAGGRYEFELNHATNSGAGDLVVINGSLSVAASPSNRFVIQLISLTSGGQSGPLAGFNNQSNYIWTLASTSGGVSGLDSAAFSVDTNGFVSDLAGGAFTVEQAGNAVVLKFHANTIIPKFMTNVQWRSSSLAFTVSGVPGKLYTLRAASELSVPMAWSVIATATADVNGAISLQDFGVTNYPQRFYQITGP